MSQLTPIQIDENTVIYIETTDHITPPSESLPAPISQEQQRGDLVDEKGVAQEAASRVAQSFELLEGTIRTYTRRTLNAFTNLGDANIEKVTLEFGVNVAGEAGVPYVTKGTAECSLKITVECLFPAKSA
ncbi:MAG: CU044_2847 family protein [Leptolyngbyaceae cyanobacterium]